MRSLRFVSFVALSLVLASAPAAAQERRPVVYEHPEAVYRLVPIEHIHAVQIQEALQSLGVPVNVFASDRNTVVLAGSAAVLDSTVKLIAQLDKPSAGADQRADAAVQVVRLGHILAGPVARALRDLAFDIAATPVDEETIVLRGPEAKVREGATLIAKMDVPTSSGGPNHRSEIINLPMQSTRNLSSLLRGVLQSPGATYNLDSSAGMLVVNGTDAEIEGVRALLRRMSEPRPSFTVHFHFIRGSIGGGDIGPLAKTPLANVASSLAKSGLSNLQLIAPMTVVTEAGKHFSASSQLHSASDNAPRSEQLSFNVEGTVLERGDGTVQLALEAVLYGPFTRAVEDKGKTQFNLETTIATKIGNYVVLAATPASTLDGDAIALVARVTRGGI